MELIIIALIAVEVVIVSVFVINILIYTNVPPGPYQGWT